MTSKVLKEKLKSYIHRQISQVAPKAIHMVPEHIKAFTEAATHFSHIIIVRATNEASLKYIRSNSKDYTPKPIDCKPKTADKDTLIRGRTALCGGLVVDPGMVGDSAFADPEKLREARDAWWRLEAHSTATEKEKKVFMRRDQSGIFVVETRPTKPHYGCLMVGKQNLSLDDIKNFTLDRYGEPLQYITGDYDLYGLIDLEEYSKPAKDRKPPKILKELKHGVEHYYTEKYGQIAEFLNRRFGPDREMIQHSSQDLVEHRGGLVYVFFPDYGDIYIQELDGTSFVLRKFYTELLKYTATD